MPVDTTVVQPLLQKAIDLMETASCWERRAAKRAHIVGLQGEKRRLRWLGREARNISDLIEHLSYDVFSIDIYGQAGSVDVSSLVCSMSTMNGIIEKLWTIRTNTHKIANELVMANFKEFSKPLYDYAERLFYILAELQRAQAEYEKADYEYHHISRYQVAWENVHDDYECMEEKQGYKDSKA